MDILSDILKSIHLRGSVYFNTCFHSPWGIDIHHQDIAAFHIIERGQCWLNMPDQKEPKPLVSGDILILPHGAPHQLCDRPHGFCWPGGEVVDQVMAGKNPFGGSSQDGLNIVCGYFQFDKGQQLPFLNALPDLIHLRQQDRHHHSWLDMVLKMTVAEAAEQTQGQTALLDKMTEVLFIQSIRAYSLQQGTDNSFLAALRDDRIVRALAAVHQSPEKPWSLDSLASIAGMSRSAFANHFKDLIKVTPMKYLMIQRMELARHKIQEGHLSLSTIAEEVGYNSDSAFNKAFKNVFGCTPASCRES